MNLTTLGRQLVIYTSASTASLLTDTRFRGQPRIKWNNLVFDLLFDFKDASCLNFIRLTNLLDLLFILYDL
jgi:hypothetical protein